jgi:hypothetical protein
VRTERERRKDDKRSLADRAGVPYQYRDNVYVSTEADGIVSIYFGGLGSPDGPGHGHYVMDAYDRIIYRRDPFDPHGSQNFADHEERWEKYNSSRSGQTGKLQTDYYFGRKGDKGGHIAINEDGNIEHVRDDDGTVLYEKYDPSRPYD